MRSWRAPTRFRSASLAVPAALLLAGCGEKRLDVQDASRQISSQLEERTGQTPRSVRCPDDEVEAKRGRRFRCTVTGRDGARFGLVATLTDDDGSFSFRVDRRPQP
jgi:Domain of unknown function (DUF4333)